MSQSKGISLIVYPRRYNLRGKPDRHSVYGVLDDGRAVNIKLRVPQEHANKHHAPSVAEFAREDRKARQACIATDANRPDQREGILLFSRVHSDPDAKPSDDGIERYVAGWASVLCEDAESPDPVIGIGRCVFEKDKQGNLKFPVHIYALDERQRVEPDTITPASLSALKGRSGQGMGAGLRIRPVSQARSGEFYQRFIAKERRLETIEELSERISKRIQRSSIEEDIEITPFQRIQSGGRGNEYYKERMEGLKKVFYASEQPTVARIAVRVTYYSDTDLTLLSRFFPLSPPLGSVDDLDTAGALRVQSSGHDGGGVIVTNLLHERANPPWATWSTQRKETQQAQDTQEAPDAPTHVGEDNKASEAQVGPSQAVEQQVLTSDEQPPAQERSGGAGDDSSTPASADTSQNPVQTPKGDEAEATDDGSGGDQAMIQTPLGRAREQVLEGRVGDGGEGSGEQVIRRRRSLAEQARMSRESRTSSEANALDGTSSLGQDKNRGDDGVHQKGEHHDEGNRPQEILSHAAPNEPQTAPAPEAHDAAPGQEAAKTAPSDGERTATPLRTSIEVPTDTHIPGQEDGEGDTAEQAQESTASGSEKAADVPNVDHEATAHDAPGVDAPDEPTDAVDDGLIGEKNTADPLDHNDEQAQPSTATDMSSNDDTVDTRATLQEKKQSASDADHSDQHSHDKNKKGAPAAPKGGMAAFALRRRKKGVDTES